MGVQLYEDFIAGKHVHNPIYRGANKAIVNSSIAASNAVALRLRNANRYELANSLISTVVQIMVMKPSDLYGLIKDMALPADDVWIEFDAVAMNTERQRLGLIPKVHNDLERFGLFVTGRKDDQTSPIKLQWFTLDRGAPTFGDSFFTLRDTKPTNWPTWALNQFARQIGIASTDAAPVHAFGQYAQKWLADPVESAWMRKLLDITNSHGEPYSTRWFAHAKPGLPNPMGASIGTFLFSLAMLSLLDNKPLFKSTTTSSGSSFVTSAGKSKPFTLYYDTVTMKMSTRRTFRALIAKSISRRPKMEHSVRDHWAYRRGSVSATCSHFWISNGIKSQQTCTHCGGLRWHRDSFKRGDAAYGTKITSHVVMR